MIMLAAAQFIMVLDTTVMNVSISQVVEDLNTTVVGLQSAITIYTLVMASFMLLGGKLGDKWGAKRAFAIGLVIYGIGSFITAISPNLTVLLIGWSVIEGLGAALVIPAIAALTASTYQGKQRVLAYGVLGGVAGASAAAGPLIGGWVGTMFSWRYVFAGETVVVAILMIFLFLIPSVKGKGASLDPLGAVLSIAGLGPGCLRDSALEPVGLDSPRSQAAHHQRRRGKPARPLPGDVVADRERLPAHRVCTPRTTGDGSRRRAAC